MCVLATLTTLTRLITTQLLSVEAPQLGKLLMFTISQMMAIKTLPKPFAYVNI